MSATTSSHLDRTQLEDKLAELRLSQQTIQEQHGAPLELHHHHHLHHPQHHLQKHSSQPPMDLQSCNMSQGSGLGRPLEPPLSPISETPPPTGIRSRASSSGTNTRSVSAAVSDESVAGDSGVFEASNRRRLSGLMAPDAVSAGGEVNLETAQVQIKLRLVFQRL